MRFAKFVTLSLAVALLLSAVQPGRASRGELEAVPGRYLVKLAGTMAPAERAAFHASIGARVVGRLDAIGVDVVDLAAPGALARYSRSPNVAYIEPDYIAHAALEPNDPCIHTPCVPGWPGTQWQLSYSNAIFGWSAYPGRFYSSSERLALPAGKVVKVAVVDTKIDRAQEDWINNGGVSADAAKGGQLDLADAKDWITDPRQQAGGISWHGTFVAGVLAAAAGNSTDPAGTGWMSQVMPLTAVDGNGRANADYVAGAILHAWQKGARVINLSLGLVEDSETVHDAIKAVTAGANPSLVVAAAGNCTGTPDACPEAFYPGSYPEVMSVAVTDAADRRALCSRYNANVSVSAPADGVVGLAPGGGTMRAFCGTSAAAPQVAGLAAMLFSQNPARTPRQVRDIIESTSDDLGPTGRDVNFGFGRINAERALRVGQTAPITTGVHTTIPPAQGGPSTITALATSSTPIVAAEYYLDHPGCSGAPGTPMQVADAGAGYKRLSATLQVTASMLPGAHPIWIRASNGATWGAYAVGALYIDSGKPTIVEDGLSDFVVQHVPGQDTAAIAFTLADDYSSAFPHTYVRVIPALSTVSNPPAVFLADIKDLQAGANVYRWTPDASVLPGQYKIQVFAADQAGNFTGVTFKKTVLVL